MKTHKTEEVQQSQRVGGHWPVLYTIPFTVSVLTVLTKAESAAGGTEP